MRKTNVSIIYDDEKLNAIRLYMHRVIWISRKSLKNLWTLCMQNMFLQMSESSLI